MAKCKHKLRIELKWTIDHTDGNQYKRFLDSYVCGQLSMAQTCNKEIGMRQTSYGGIMRDGGEGRNIDIIFDQDTCPHSPLDGSSTYKRRNFNQLDTVLKHIDKVIGEIPEDSRPTAVISLKNYRTPWVQVDTRRSTLLLRKGYKVISLVEPARLGKVNATEVHFYGEPRITYKVAQAYKQAVRNKSNHGNIVKVMAELSETQIGDNWICVFRDTDGNQFMWGRSLVSRAPVYSRVMYTPDLPNLTLKYPKRGPIHSDLVAVPL